VWLGPAGRAEQQSSAGKSDDAEQQQPDDNEAGNQEGASGADGYPQMTEKQRRLFELQLKMVRELSHSMSFSSSVPSCL
jgi:hypothetical protein